MISGFRAFQVGLKVRCWMLGESGASLFLVYNSLVGEVLVSCRELWLVGLEYMQGGWEFELRGGAPLFDFAGG